MIFHCAWFSIFEIKSTMFISKTQSQRSKTVINGFYAGFYLYVMLAWFRDKKYSKKQCFWRKIWSVTLTLLWICCHQTLKNVPRPQKRRIDAISLYLVGSWFCNEIPLEQHPGRLHAWDMTCWKSPFIVKRKNYDLKFFVIMIFSSKKSKVIKNFVFTKSFLIIIQRSNTHFLHIFGVYSPVLTYKLYDFLQKSQNQPKSKA